VLLLGASISQVLFPFMTRWVVFFPFGMFLVYLPALQENREGRLFQNEDALEKSFPPLLPLSCIEGWQPFPPLFSGRRNSFFSPDCLEPFSAVFRLDPEWRVVPPAV